VGALATAELVVSSTRRFVLESLQHLARGRKSRVTVDRLMRTGIKACFPENSLADAARVMWEYDCGCVPVVDASGRVTGMVTDRDICMSAYFRGAALREISIGDAMSRDVLSVRPGDSIQSAEALMRHVQVRRLPVADGDGRLLGILSLNDLAIAAERRQRSTRAPEIDLREVALTLSAVSRQRDSVPRGSTGFPS
jgi:CBS domain-containing protein